MLKYAEKRRQVRYYTAHTELSTITIHRRPHADDWHWQVVCDRGDRRYPSATASGLCSEHDTLLLVKVRAQHVARALDNAISDGDGIC